MSTGMRIHGLTMASMLSIAMFAVAYLVFFMKHMAHASGGLGLLAFFVLGHGLMIFWFVFRTTGGWPIQERIADALADALLGGFAFMLCLVVMLLVTLGV